MEKDKNSIGKKTGRVYTVSLEDMEFFGFHGCRDDEKVNGNVFVVGFCGEYRSVAGETDCLEDAIDYGKVYGCIASVMNGERCNLLETLACRAVSAIASAFPGFIRFDVTVRKKNPPVAGPCAWSGIKMEWKKDEQDSLRHTRM